MAASRARATGLRGRRGVSVTRGEAMEGACALVRQRRRCVIGQGSKIVCKQLHELELDVP